MDIKNENQCVEEEEADSGLENPSDSGHSGDEDSDKLIQNENENTSLPVENQLTELPAAQRRIKVYHKSSLLISEIEKQLEERFKVTSFYKALLESQTETVDFSVTSKSVRPDWLDEEKFKRGQKFARDHLFCINFSEMLSLFIIFSEPLALAPLIFTGKSDSPFKAFKRYLSTVSKLMSWYWDDVWNEAESSGRKNLTIVSNMHKNVFEKLTNSSKEDLGQKTTLGDPETTCLWCPLVDVVRKDFQENACVPKANFEELRKKEKVWVSQADMSITQFGFVGLAVTYPESFGIHLASEEDLDAFIHLWRGLGYLLGIKDDYNFCNTDLEGVRRRTRFFLEACAKPLFQEVSCEWEHMCRCMTAGISFYLPQVNFESSLLYLCHVLNIKAPNLQKRMSFGAYMIFQIHKLIFYLMKFPGVLYWLNSRMIKIIKDAQNATPEVLTKWKNKKFPYMDQPGKCPIRS